jgi:hypothetical protein
MISTCNLLEFIFNKFTNADKQVKRLCYELCTNLIGIYLKKEEDDESGDSGDEESNASHYRKMLLKIKEFSNQNTSSSKKTKRPTSNTGHLTKDYLSYLNGLSEDDSHSEARDDINSMYVPLFHGVPLMQSQYTNQEQREIGKNVQAINEKLLERFLKKTNSELTSKEKIMISIHSRTSTASAGLQSLYEVLTANQSKRNELNEKSEILQNHFKNLLDQDQKTAIGTYVGQFSKTFSKEFWPAFKNPEYPDGIVKYPFPIIATSKAVDHALRFAIGNNVERSKGETPMEPEYDQTGHPKHRLAGLLYITLHKLSDIVKDQKKGSFIDFNLDLRNAKGYGQFSHQLECDFFGKIDVKKIVYILPIVYPSIRSENEKGFNSDYHYDIFGLSSGSDDVVGVLNPSKIKPDLWESPNPVLTKHLTGFGRMFVPAFGILANDLFSKIETMEENSSKKILVTINNKGELILYNTKWERKEEFSEAQKDVDITSKSNETADKRVWWKIASSL